MTADVKMHSSASRSPRCINRGKYGGQPTIWRSWFAPMRLQKPWNLYPQNNESETCFGAHRDSVLGTTSRSRWGALPAPRPSATFPRVCAHFGWPQTPCFSRGQYGKTPRDPHIFRTCLRSGTSELAIRAMIAECSRPTSATAGLTFPRFPWVFSPINGRVTTRTGGNVVFVPAC